ncbi:MAG: hypothetical protein A2Y84_01435 [Candidatus Colwellbacteria bacterium RBG_13_48_8]|uniref:DUF4115 domain-containing protein n=1 Tax=Candidatus Colwellbacteria bacterium RBG_13_48_8 TaxID=1797685 RepID=A0A1G1YWH1_9BACT|nr:MAG: hypothetical protein A2Y84_01435 [Candidatus Colwellbacteria bacterium RBG_13_48_8]
MISENQDISETLKELMRARDIGPQKLSSLTDVPRRFIDAILQGEFNKLPAYPYIRGYLFKISNILGADNDQLWRIYRSSAETVSSGEKDRLPINRFALKRVSPRKVVFWLLPVLVLVFLATNLNHIIGKPTIDISLPDSTQEQVIKIEGRIDPGDKLTLNEELVYTSEEGFFQKDIQLEPGLNTLRFRVERYLGRETVVIKQVFFQSPVETPKEQPNDQENSA